MTRRLPTGVEGRHRAQCATRRGGPRCTCQPSYRASISDHGRLLRGPWRPSQREAETWRHKALQERAAGARTPNEITLRDAWADWYAGALSGTIPNRRGQRYKPSALRGYERAWRIRIDAELGAHRVADIQREDLQALVDRLAQAGASRSTINNTLDPVRVISNRSSGKMGYAIASAAQAAGADVTLISGPTALAAPAGVRQVQIETASELREAVLALLPDAEAVVMAAAVADYRVAEPSDVKLKKRDARGEVTLRLTENADVLKAVMAKRRPGTFVVGFKAETGDPVAEATRMLREKGPDLVVANDVSAGVFGADTDTVTFVSVDGAEALPRLPKAEVARRLVQRIAQALGGAS